jgi:hypothetical protein
MRLASHTRRRRRHPLSLGLAGIAALAACVSSPHLATRAPTLLIRVEGRADPSSPLMLWAVPRAGERLRLGLLTSAGSNLVKFDRVDPAVTYRFVAERQGAESVTSPPFTPGETGAVTWNLTTNLITPVETPTP